MPTQTEIAAVNAAGLVQGITLVTFPAASSIFTAKSEYALSSGLYGDISCRRSRWRSRPPCSARGSPAG